MNPRLQTLPVLALLGLALGGCPSEAPKPTEGKPAEAKPAEAKPAEAKPAEAKPTTAKPTTAKPTTAKPTTAKPADGKEIVFNPKTPPPGYTNCHRNHCHRVGGGVASYKQVMAEMGATKIEGVAKAAPMPKAPEDVAAAPKDAKKSKSGLSWKVLRKGDGKDKPTKESVVSVHYTGWTAEGKGFDSSVSRGKPATFPLSRVFPGWIEGIQLMTVGEERRFWVPQELAFNGRPGRPTGTLVFDIELLEIKKKQ